jgi:hypothetical protein
MATLVYSSGRKRNITPNDFSWENNVNRYVNASRLIDAIFHLSKKKDEMVVKKRIVRSSRNVWVIKLKP